MAKRFTETNKWQDGWFLSLPNDYRIIWLWLVDNCSIAGFWKKDFDSLNFFYKPSTPTSFIDETKFKEIFNGRCFDLGEYFFIPKFLKVQYPQGLTSNKPIIISIRKEIYKRLGNDYSIITQSLGNDYPMITQSLDMIAQSYKIKDKDKDNKKEGGMEGKNTKILFEIKKEIDLAGQTSEVEKIEFNIFFDSWNKFAKESNLISARELSPARKQKVTKRLSEHPLEWWNEVFSLCARTLFLNGDSKEGWRASFDWIVANSDNGVKVLEGKYGEPKKSPITPGQIKKGGDADGTGSGDGAKIKGQIDYSKY